MQTFDYKFVNVRTLFGALRFFSDGWGPYQGRHDAWLHRIRAQTLPPLPDYLPIEFTSIPTTPFTRMAFESPAASLLPAESTMAHALYIPSSHSSTYPGIIPIHDNHTSSKISSKDCSAPLVLLLAATGDHGFWRRLLMHSWILRKRGISSVILESPFYGRRRPAGQVGALLRTVTSLGDLGRATIEESRYILTYFRRFGHKRMAVAGISQGGLHAAMVAAATPEWPVGVVAALAPHSAAPVFTDGVLATVVDWQALGPAARPRLREVLALSDISYFPRAHPDAKEKLIFARDDLYITHESVEIWRRTRPHMTVRWVSGGHVTASMAHFPAINKAILDVLSDHDD